MQALSITDADILRLLFYNLYIYFDQKINDTKSKIFRGGFSLRSRNR